MPYCTIQRNFPIDMILGLPEMHQNVAQKRGGGPPIRFINIQKTKGRSTDPIPNPCLLTISLGCMVHMYMIVLFAFIIKISTPFLVWYIWL